MEIESRFPDFFESANFKTASQHMQDEITALIEQFLEKGFEVWPSWRKLHSTTQNKVWTLRTQAQEKRSGFVNVVTVYPRANSLKVEVYLGQKNKQYFNFSRFNENLKLFEIAINNYKNNIGKSLKLLAP